MQLYTESFKLIVESQAWTQTSKRALIAELKQCGKRRDLERGKALHSTAILSGYQNNIHVLNTLISMYSKCGCMDSARNVFNNMLHRNVVSWTALIHGYVENGQSETALEMFNIMDFAPNHYTFVAVLKACTSFTSGSDKEICLRRGMTVHRQAEEVGFDRDLYVGSALVDMYSKCGEMQRARTVFEGMVQRDVVSWTALIAGHVENGEFSSALKLFDSMSCAPNNVTLACALKACAGLGTRDNLDVKEKGMAVHRRAVELGFEKDIVVASTLVDMYCKCGEMERARRVFNKMKHRNFVSWNALMFGYMENGESLKSLEVYYSMDCAPNHVTFIAALKACGSLGALENGQRIHARVRQLGMEQFEPVATSLLDFYGKCGNISGAEDVFARMQTRSTASWNALVGAYNSVGDTATVLSMVKRMEECGVQLNAVTMSLVLSACSQAGMVEEGEKYFGSMPKHGIVPTIEHYTCLVDMLGQANKLEEAVLVVKRMPFEGDSVLWTTLLGACRRWRNVEVGKVVVNALVTLNRGSSFSRTADYNKIKLM